MTLLPASDTSNLAWIQEWKIETSEPNKGSTTGQLAKGCMSAFRKILKQLSRNDEISTAAFRQLERSCSSLVLWDTGYGVGDGKLDDALARSRTLRRATLEPLVSISNTLTDRLMPLLHLTDEKLGAYRAVKSIVAEAQICLHEDYSDSPDSDDSASDSSVLGSSDWDEIAEDLWTDTQCLLELDPLITCPAPDPIPMPKGGEQAPARWSPHLAYSDRITYRFPKADASLVERLARANWERFLKSTADREKNQAAREAPALDQQPVPNTATAPPRSELVSKFHDSGLGTSIYTGGSCSYPETVMSYRQQGRESIRIPPLPDHAKKGKPFDCVACGKELMISNNPAWKTREDWIQHLALGHGLEPFWSSFTCPLCHEETGHGKFAISRHLSSHMEEISLAALPVSVESDDESGSDVSVSDASSESSNDVDVKDCCLCGDSSAKAEMVRCVGKHSPAAWFHRSCVQVNAEEPVDSQWHCHPCKSGGLVCSGWNCRARFSDHASLEAHTNERHRLRATSLPFQPSNTSNPHISVSIREYAANSVEATLPSCAIFGDVVKCPTPFLADLLHNLEGTEQVKTSPSPEWRGWRFVAQFETASYAKKAATFLHGLFLPPGYSSVDLWISPQTYQANKTPPTESKSQPHLESAAMANSVSRADGDEEPYIIQCICGVSEDDGMAIYCEQCDTWQHIECFYPDSQEAAMRADFVHQCHECNPRPLDRNRAAARLQQLKTPTKVDESTFYEGLRLRASPHRPRLEVFRWVQENCKPEDEGEDKMEDHGAPPVAIPKPPNLDEGKHELPGRKSRINMTDFSVNMCREPGCGREFKRPCDLRKHEKKHSRPWKCAVQSCKYHKYGWTTEKEMIRHHNDKHTPGPTAFECFFKPCPYKTKRASNCRHHMEKAHGLAYPRTKSKKRTEPRRGVVAALAAPNDDDANAILEAFERQLKDAPAGNREPMLLDSMATDRPLKPGPPPLESLGLDLPREVDRADYGELDNSQALEPDIYDSSGSRAQVHL